MGPAAISVDGLGAIAAVHRGIAVWFQHGRDLLLFVLIGALLLFIPNLCLVPLLDINHDATPLAIIAIALHACVRTIVGLAAIRWYYLITLRTGAVVIEPSD